MRAVVDLRQLRSGELRVTLRGGEALVAEQLLNGAEVGAFFKQMGSEGVAQRVRVNVGGKPAQDGDALDDAADAARGEPRLAAILSRPRSCRLRKAPACSAAFALPAAARRGGALGDVGTERLGGCVAQWNVALLLPFAADQDRFVGPVNVVEIEPGELRVADAAAVEHLENRLVARGPT